MEKLDLRGLKVVIKEKGKVQALKVKLQNLLIIVENVLWERISVIDLNCCTEILGSVKVVLISYFSHDSFPIWQNNIQYWQQDTKILQFWNLSIKVRRQTCNIHYNAYLCLTNEYKVVCSCVKYYTFLSFIYDYHP